MSEGSDREFEYDVALSFAGEDRAYVQGIAGRLRAHGVRIFYDEYAAVGADLYELLDEVYRKRAHFVIAFISANYVNKPRPKHEPRSTLARALVEYQPYFLPVRLDDAELPGLRPSVGYVDAHSTTPDQLVRLILQKLGRLPSHVFISYSRYDDHFVKRLSEDLRSAGFTVWVDVEQIIPGQSWEQELRRAIEDAVALIYVSSESSVRSQWVPSELIAVRATGRLVIPVVIDDIGAEQMPDALRSFQWADFRTDYQRGLQSLLGALAPGVVPGEPRETVPAKSKGYVFLSYAKEDQQFIQALRSFLHENRYGYWDYQESDRDYHGQMFTELEGIIREAAAILSILTPAWKVSKWTIREYLFSEEVGTPVFLLMVDEIGPTLVIAGIPYIDFTTNEQQGFERLDRELKRKGL